MDQASKIAELNDRLRRHHIGGRVMITQGIQALDQDTITEIIAAVAAFSDFTPDNDPHHEHDCAVMTVGEHRIIFKIDAYDREMTFASPAPADPAVTLRVLPGGFVRREVGHIPQIGLSRHGMPRCPMGHRQ